MIAPLLGPLGQAPTSPEAFPTVASTSFIISLVVLSLKKLASHLHFDTQYRYTKTVKQLLGLLNTLEESHHRPC